MFSSIMRLFCKHQWFQKFDQQGRRMYLECLGCGKQTKGVTTGTTPLGKPWEYSNERPEHGGTWASLKQTA